MSYRLTSYFSQPIGAISKVTEFWMIVISLALTCLLIVLRSFIFRERTKPRRYQMSIMTFGDDHRDSNDPGALDDWPSEIAAPAEFLTGRRAEAADSADLFSPTVKLSVGERRLRSECKSQGRSANRMMIRA